MKHPFALVTDSTSNLAPGLAAQLGIRVVPGSFAFEDERLPDSVESSAVLYSKMASGAAGPRVFGPTEQAWTEAFRDGLATSEAVLCLVTPFDVSSAFTTASAAMLAIQFDEPEARIKIVNPGVGSAGLASLLVTIANGGLGGLEEALDAIERLEPLCDTIFAPADTCWLRTSGRLSMIEERIGQLESDVPVVRVGTRITGVARASEDNFAASLASAAVRRAGPARHLNVTIAHAEAEERATKVEAAIREAASVASIETVPLLASIGAQLGPGAVGLGVAPAHCGEED